MSDSKAIVTVSSLVDSPAYRSRFEQVLGARAPQFISSLITAVNSSALRNAEPKSVIAAAMVAATLDLPIEKNLGYAHIVPYKGIAQFQMGYKGYIQLGLRTGQYAKLNDVIIPHGVLKGYNQLSGDLDLDWSNADETQPADGYVCYFRLVSGFEKTVFWSREKVEKHAKRYSASYSKQDSTWKTNFDAMALKTVIKFALAKYGILSVQMAKALEHDQAYQVDVDTAPLFDNEEDTTPKKPIFPGKKGKASTPETIDIPPAEEATESSPADDEAQTPPPPDDNQDRQPELVAKLREHQQEHGWSDLELMAALRAAKIIGRSTQLDFEDMAKQTLTTILSQLPQLLKSIEASRPKAAD